MGAYSVSKRGLEAFADCLRVEMASFGVKVRDIFMHFNFYYFFPFCYFELTFTLVLLGLRLPLVLLAPHSPGCLNRGNSCIPD